MMLRKHWHVEGGPNCVLCDSDVREYLDHPFFGCDLAKECWQSIGLTWDLSRNSRDHIMMAMGSLHHPNFMEIFASAAWNIWKEHNNFIFKGVEPSLNAWRCRAKQDLLLHRFRVKPSLVQKLLDITMLFFH